jgi:hypothetical protein
VQIVDSLFSVVSAIGGGGAIEFTVSPTCRYYLHHETFLEIRNSNFTNCTTEGNGGAILVNSASDTDLVDVKILACIFTSCRSSCNGGALHLFGYSVSAEISSIITLCYSNYSGGAISASDGVLLSIIGSVIH